MCISPGARLISEGPSPSNVTSCRCSAHFPAPFGAQVVEECQSALAWLHAKRDLQKQLGKAEDPVLLTADIKKKEDTLHRVAQPILTKPAPPPPKV